MRTGHALLIAMLVAAMPAGAAGGGPSLNKQGKSAVQLRAVVEERLSLVSGTQLVGLSLFPRQMARAEQPISFTTSWNLERTRTAVVVSAFFEDAHSALRAVGTPAGVDAIEPADVWGRASHGAFTPFSATVGLSGHGIRLFRQPLKPGVNDMASRTDELELQIDMTRKALRAAGKYQGVLTLVAEAY